MLENEDLTRLIGHLSDGTPIWLQGGGAPEDEDADDELEDEETDDEDEEEEWAPPTREEWEATQRKLARANKEAAKRRKLLRSRASEEDEDGTDDDGEDEGKGPTRKELQRLLARAEARAEAKYKPALVKQAAKAALADAGFVGDITARTMALLNLDELEVDEDGDIVGLEEQIEELKEEVPQLFRRARTTTTKTTERKKLDGGNRTQAKKELTYAEKLARQLMG